jgi:drug/metabolite transporter (DMT)-like permease
MGRGELLTLPAVYGLIVLTTVLWGGGPVAGKLALADLPLMTTGVLRFGLAALIYLSLGFGQLSCWKELSRTDLVMLLALGVTGFFLGHVLFMLGIKLAPASHASIIAPTTGPICTMLLAARLGGERVTPAQWLGTAVCAAGVLLVVRPAGAAGADAVLVLLGDLSLLAGGAAWGSYSYLSRVTMRRVPSGVALTHANWIGAVLLLPFAFMERPWSVLSAVSGPAWLGLLYLAVPNTLLALYLWNLGIQRVGVARTAVFTNLVPVFGVLVAWLVLGDRLAPVQVAGGALSLLGVWICQFRRPGPDAAQAVAGAREPARRPGT